MSNTPQPRNLGTALALSIALMVAVALAFSTAPAQTAPRPQSTTEPPPPIEVVVFERKDCVPCWLFRRDVAPSYLRSSRQRMAPMRLVEFSPAEASFPGLAAPIVILPTAVVFSSGREVARIEGYTGPEPFYQTMSHLFGMLRP
ncbi:MAG: hypothetical protein ACFCUN_03760 [Hyphomicrobiaceae bacterium]